MMTGEIKVPRMAKHQRNKVLTTLLIKNKKCKECYDLVVKLLGSEIKADKWFVVDHPMFGNISVVEMFLLGRGHKVLEFVKDRIAGDIP